MTFRSLLLLSPTVLLAACVTPPERVEPVTSFAAAQACSSEPARPGTGFQTETPLATDAVSAPVNALSGCLTRTDGSQTPYALIALPDLPNVASVFAGSIQEYGRILAPEVQTLDGDLQPVREFGPERFTVRGLGYGAFFVPRPNEAYVLVTAAPDLVDASHAPTSRYTAAALEQYEGVFSYEGLAFVRVHYAEPEVDHAADPEPMTD